jgi:hypothetical protein
VLDPAQDWLKTDSGFRNRLMGALYPHEIKRRCALHLWRKFLRFRFPS